MTGSPGWSARSNFGQMGFIVDGETGRKRRVHALIFTAVVSRHMFVWLTYSQTLVAMIAGCEAAWEFFGGCFKVLIPDNDLRASRVRRLGTVRNPGRHHCHVTRTHGSHLSVDLELELAIQDDDDLLLFVHMHWRHRVRRERDEVRHGALAEDGPELEPGDETRPG